MSQFSRIVTTVAGGLLLLAVLAAPSAQAQDAAALFVSRGCEACHGAAGNAPIGGLYPRLAGQSRDYLVAQLQAFRAVERQGGNSAAMWSFATGLSDAEIKSLATYLSRVK